MNTQHSQRHISLDNWQQPGSDVLQYVAMRLSEDSATESEVVDELVQCGMSIDDAKSAVKGVMSTMESASFLSEQAEKDEFDQKIRSYVIVSLKNGKSAAEVERDIIDAGLSQSQASKIVKETLAKVSRAVSKDLNEEYTSPLNVFGSRSYAEKKVRQKLVDNGWNKETAGEIVKGGKIEETMSPRSFLILGVILMIVGVAMEYLREVLAISLDKGVLQWIVTRNGTFALCIVMAIGGFLLFVRGVITSFKRH